MGLRAVRDRVQEAKRAPKGEASKSYVLLAAVQAGLEKALKGWKLNIEGVRAGDRTDAQMGPYDEDSDDFTLYAYGPNRDLINVNSSNNADEHVVSAQLVGEKHLKKTWEKVGKGDAKKIVAWVLDAMPKAGIEVQEGVQRTVADLLVQLHEGDEKKLKLSEVQKYVGEFKKQVERSGWTVAETKVEKKDARIVVSFIIDEEYEFTLVLQASEDEDSRPGEVDGTWTLWKAGRNKQRKGNPALFGGSEDIWRDSFGPLSLDLAVDHDAGITRRRDVAR